MKKCQLLLWPLFDSAFFGKNGHSCWSCRLSFQASFSKLCPIMHDDPDCIDIPAMQLTTTTHCLNMRQNYKMLASPISWITIMMGRCCTVCFIKHNLIHFSWRTPHCVLWYREILSAFCSAKYEYLKSGWWWHNIAEPKKSARLSKRCCCPSRF